MGEEGGVITREHLTFNNVCSLVLSDSDMDSEKVSLIRLSVSDGQKTRRSKGVSLICTGPLQKLNTYAIFAKVFTYPLR